MITVFYKFEQKIDQIYSKQYHDIFKLLPAELFFRKREYVFSFYMMPPHWNDFYC